MAKRKCRCCGSFTECNDIRLCPSCVDDICPTADPRIEMHCEHSVHVRERIAELDAKANDLERERDEAQEELAHAKREIAEFKGEPAYGETSETYAMYKDWKAQLHAAGYEQCNVSTGLRLALKELADAREEDKRWRGESMNADADGSLGRRARRLGLIRP